jgi:hypothetical protein
LVKMLVRFQAEQEKQTKNDHSKQKPS